MSEFKLGIEADENEFLIDSIAIYDCNTGTLLRKGQVQLPRNELKWSKASNYFWTVIPSICNICLHLLVDAE